MSGEQAARQARVERKTRETRILLHLNLDGTGQATIETGIPFFNHMLEALTKHSLLDVALDAKGDLDVDLHHTVEDVGLVLGQAVHQALGDKRGIVRFGHAVVPMDETLVSAAIDLSGRPYIVFGVPLARARLGKLRPGSAQGLLPRLRHRGPDEPARDHARRREPPPRGGGRLQVGRARARPGDPARPPHRRDPAVHQGRPVTGSP
jgi:imidazoleglycerol phosphate dehydratase HisB